MFAYCGNNPVNRDDPNGDFWRELLAGICIVARLPEEVVAVVTIAVVAVTVGVVASCANAMIKEYRNSHVVYSDSNSGRSKNKLKPDPKAEGAHSTFKRDSKTGKITNHATWKPNSKNPTGFDSEKRYDGVGKPHYNPVTRERLLPACS